MSELQAFVMYKNLTSVVVDSDPQFEYTKVTKDQCDFLISDKDGLFVSGMIIREDLDDLAVPTRLLNVEGKVQAYTNAVELSCTTLKYLTGLNLSPVYHTSLTEINSGSYDFESSRSFYYLNEEKVPKGIRSYGYYEYLYTLYPTIRVGNKSLLSKVLSESSDPNLLDWKRSMSKYD